jgi:hypothetical protein
MDMLSTIFHAKYIQFATLAEVWLAAGAKRFSVWENDQMLGQWSAETSFDDDDLITAPIRVGETYLGMLQVTGLNGPQTQTRLTTEATWIAELIKLEYGFDDLISGLAEWRTPALKISRLFDLNSQPVAISHIFRRLIREAKQLVQAEGSFIALDRVRCPLIIEQYPVSIVDEASLNYFFERMEADGLQELVLDREAAPNIVPAEVASLYLSAIPLADKTMIILGFSLPKPISLSDSNLRAAREITHYIETQLETLPLTWAADSVSI